MREDQSKALGLCGMSLAGYAVAYLTSILLARTLTVRDFDDYNVAVSAVLVLASVATLGLEKYAIRCLPVFRNAGDWAQSRGFIRFSRRMIIASSLILAAALTGVVESILSFQGKDYHISIAIVAAFLPLIALFQLNLEVVTAYGGQLLGTAVYRLLFPILFLAFNILVYTTPVKSTAVSATMCYGTAWVVACVVIDLLARRRTPSSVRIALPAFDREAWLRGSLPMLGSSVGLTMLAQMGTIILELNHPNQFVVSAYAVAFQTGSFIVIFATATNRLYTPMLSENLASGDFAAMESARRSRLRFIGPLTAGYLVLILVFGRSILALFGDDFESAYPALCIVAIGASVSTVFALAPTYMLFRDQNRLVLFAILSSALLNLVLCFPLSANYGATGAAIAYAVSISLLHIFLRTVAIYDFFRQSAGRD